MDTPNLNEIASKIAISEILARYCRGIDRCDLATLQSAFWSDATADYGTGDVGAQQWCIDVIAALKTMERTQHSISNVLIELEGDSASVETYCRAYHEVKTPGGMREMMVGGRYLDRFSRREGIWRIVARRYVMDFNQNGISTSEWKEGLYAGLKVIGMRFPEDPLYATAGKSLAR